MPASPADALVGGKTVAFEHAGAASPLGLASRQGAAQELASRRHSGPPLTASAIVDAFLECNCQEDSGAAVEPWTSKGGFSIFDEEEIFSPRSLRPDELIGAPDGAPHTLSAAFPDLRLLTRVVMASVEKVSQGASVYARSRARSLPRAAKQVEPLCLASVLDRDLPGRCTVCLERLEAGHETWRLPCFHSFHKVCMIRVLQARRAGHVCPNCRCSIKLACEASLTMLSPLEPPDVKRPAPRREGECSAPRARIGLLRGGSPHSARGRARA